MIATAEYSKLEALRMRKARTLVRPVSQDMLSDRYDLRQGL
jgi:hypothetical protein